MPTQGLMYPGANPSVNGNQITVERYVKNPTLVYRSLSDLSKERFVSDFIFAAGDAQGGAVLYDEISENDLYPEGGANGGLPTEIAPGDPFPTVGDSQGDPKTAHVTKRGSAFPLTYEAVRRDQRDVLQRGLIKLRNASVKAHDQVSMNLLLTHANVRTAAAAEAWSGTTAGVPANDTFSAVSAVEQADMGYTVDTAILNPAEALKLLKRTDLRDYLPRENTSVNPILTGRLSGMFGIANWIVTNRMTAGTVVFLQRQVAGSIRDEVPFFTDVIDEKKRQRYLIMAGRVSVPIITDPLAVFKLTGC